MDVSKEEFVKLVQQFESECSIKANSNKFFSDRRIQNYLARDMSFESNHPSLDPVEDALEIDIYNKLPESIPYRDANILSDEFYAAGTRENHSEFFRKVLINFIKNVNNIKIGGPHDIHRVADDVHQSFISAKKKDFPNFYIHCIWKECHSTTCVSIFESKKRRVLATVFLNSIHSHDTFEYIKKKFLKVLYSSIDEYYEKYKKIIRNFIEEVFDVNIKDLNLKKIKKCIKINNEHKSALIINYNYFSDYCDQEYKALTNNKNIETFFYLTNKSYSSGEFFSEISIEHHPKSPFIDASHNLQLENDDNNCVLYSINFIEAIVTMLQDKEIAAEVIRLCYSESYQIGLNKIFHDRLKQYLPCYYNADGTTKSQDEIKNYHLKQRWNLAKLYFEYFYSVPVKTKLYGNSFFYNSNQECPTEANFIQEKDWPSSQEFFP